MELEYNVNVPWHHVTSFSNWLHASIQERSRTSCENKAIKTKQFRQLNWNDDKSLEFYEFIYLFIYLLFLFFFVFFFFVRSSVVLYVYYNFCMLILYANVLFVWFLAFIPCFCDSWSNSIEYRRDQDRWREIDYLHTSAWTKNNLFKFLESNVIFNAA